MQLPLEALDLAVVREGRRCWKGGGGKWGLDRETKERYFKM